MASGGHAARRFWRWLVGDSWKRALARLVVVGAAAGIGALLFVSAGLAPIAASEPHWPITRVLLHYAMIRSVQTHALGVKEPPPGERALDDQAMVLKGAGHYASGCLACHGAPGTPRAEVVRHMEPAPPYLPPKIDQWSDRQLFWIVRHGVKYTAMPAWPSQQRDDEVWAMVAFLRRLPRLQPEEFRRLAYGEGAAMAAEGAASLVSIGNGTGVATPRTDAPGRASPQTATLRGPASADTAPTAAESGQDSPGLAVRVADCARCHGRDGTGRGTGAFPALAGQSEHYLLESLRAYAEGDRHSGVMAPVAAGLGAGEMRALARYYAALPADGAGAAATSTALTAPAGAASSSRGAPAAATSPALQAAATPGSAPAAHAGTGSRLQAPTPAQPQAQGQAQAQAQAASAERGERLARRGDAAARIPSCVECHGPGGDRRNPHYPRLAGQHPDYLALQLQLFRQGRRGGGGYAHIMHTVAASLEPQDIRDLAAWYGSLPAQSVTTRMAPAPAPAAGNRPTEPSRSR
jgi:cytochrome c553